MTRKGFIKLDRSVWDDPLFKGEPFSKREAWIWMMSMADYKTGTLTMSIKEAAETWHWSFDKARRFLEKLRALSMITPKETPKENAKGIFPATSCYSICCISTSGNNAKGGCQQQRQLARVPIIEIKNNKEYTHTTRTRVGEGDFKNETFNDAQMRAKVFEKYGIGENGYASLLEEFDAQTEPHASLREYEKHFFYWLPRQAERMRNPKPKKTKKDGDNRKHTETRAEQLRRWKEEEAAFHADARGAELQGAL